MGLWNKNEEKSIKVVGLMVTIFNEYIPLLFFF